MKTGRKAKQKKPATGTLPDSPSNRCRALVRVDGRSIRKKIRKDYEKTLDVHQQSRRVIDQFYQTDQPKYERWRSSHFGVLLTEIREMASKLETEAAIVKRVYQEAFLSGISEVRAYKRLMESWNNPESHPKHFDEESPDGWQNPYQAEPGQVNGEDEFDSEDALRHLFEQLFGMPGPERQSQDTWGFPFEQLSAPAPVIQASKRVKELYRAVVRRLHPDKQQVMTAQKTEWWHQAQAAYEAGDGEQLEVILTLCEIDEAGTTEQTSASLLQRITAQMKMSLRECKRQISKLKRDPSWNFSGRTDLQEFALKMRYELTAELRGLRGRWKEIHDQLEKWKAASEKPRLARRRKIPPAEPEFQF